jgi:hypothetical protein
MREDRLGEDTNLQSLFDLQGTQEKDATQGRERRQRVKSGLHGRRRL